MATDNTLLDDLLTNFDTCAMGEDYRPVDIAASHAGRLLQLLTNQVEASLALALLTVVGKKIVDLARARLEEPVFDSE